MSNTIEKRPSGRITIHLGSGSGAIDAPAGVTAEQAREIACERYPLGSHNRKKNIIAALRKIADEAKAEWERELSQRGDFVTN